MKVAIHLKGAFGLIFKRRSFEKRSFKKDLLEELFLKEWFLFGLNMSKVNLEE